MYIIIQKKINKVYCKTTLCSDISVDRWGWEKGGSGVHNLRGISGMISETVTFKTNSLKEVVCSRGILSRVMLTYGGFCPKGSCPGGLCPDTC